jgi:type II secretion system protein L
VTSILLVKQCGVDNYEWLCVDQKRGGANSSPVFFVGDGERLLEQASTITSVILLAEAEAVALTAVNFEAHERKLLRQTIPYTLEDDCIEDVDQLHFSLGQIDQSTVQLAIISRQKLEQGLLDLEKQGVEVNQFMSELTFVPLVKNSWSLLVEDGRWLVRSDENRGFCLTSDVAGFGLQLLMDEADQLPDSLMVYCQPDQQSALLNQIPELLRGAVQWHDLAYWQVIAEGLEQHKPTNGINLLQGDFALSLPWKKWLKTWRIAAILLLSGIVFQLVTTITKLEVLESRNVELRANIEQAYRNVIPRGAVLDPEKQLRRQVNAMKGESGQGFVSLLTIIGPVLANVDGLVLQSLNYNEKQSEVRLTIMASSFDDVETARADLEALGLNAELTGSSSEGDKTRDRLRVRG